LRHQKKVANFQQGSAMTTRGPMMEALLTLRIPAELSPPPDLTKQPELPEPPEPREPARPPSCLRNCFCVFRTIFWFNVGALVYLSVALAPAFMKYLKESRSDLSLEEIRFSATFWYVVLIAAPIVVVYYTHNVRRWAR
jgi:hypothetical protein